MCPRMREGDTPLPSTGSLHEVLQILCSETKRFLVGINLLLNRESSRVAPLSLSFLSYVLGLGIVKGARGIVGWMGGGGECARRDT